MLASAAMRKYLLTIPALIVLAAHAATSFGASCNEVFSSPEKKKVSWYSAAASRVLSLFLLKQTHSIELMEEGFFEAKKEGEIVVGLNGDDGFFSKRYNSESGDYLTGRFHDDGKSVHHFRVSSPDDAVRALMEVHGEFGPIKRAVFFGHGSPGSIDLGGRNLGRGWYSLNSKRLSSLPVDLFAPDATVVLMSCSCLAGYSIAPNYGVNTFKKIFSKLMKQGGTVIGSRRIVMMHLGEYGDPKAKELDQRLSEVLKNLPRLEKATLYAAGISFLGMIIVIEKGLGFFIHDWKTVLGKKVIMINIPPKEKKHSRVDISHPLFLPTSASYVLPFIDHQPCA